MAEPLDEVPLMLKTLGDGGGGGFEVGRTGVRKRQRVGSSEPPGPRRQRRLQRGHIWVD